jgi:lipocalin
MNFITELAKDPVVCDTVPGLPFTFEPERYMGNWFGQMHSKDQPFQSDAWTCSQASYTDLDLEAGTFKVYNSGSSRWYGPRFGVHGDAKYPADTISTFGEGQLFVKFFFQDWYDTPNYQIIDTDYDTYTVLYSCHEDDMQYLWLMTREPMPEQTLIDQMMETARAALPNFVWENEVKDTQNPDRCTYVKTGDTWDSIVDLHPTTF